MRRKNSPKHLAPKTANNYGNKAKAAILAGTMALALIPAPAFAAPQSQMPNEPAPMNQSMEGGTAEALNAYMAPEQSPMPSNMTNSDRPEELPNGQDGSQSGEQAPQQEQQDPPAFDQENPNEQQPSDDGEEPPAKPEDGEEPPAKPEDDQQRPEAPQGQQGGIWQSFNPSDFMRDIIQRLSKIMGIQIEDSKIEEIMRAMEPQQPGIANQQGQPGGQPGQPGQPGDQQGQPGQPGDQQGQPGQPGDQQGQLGQPGQPGDQQSNQPGQPGDQQGNQPGGQPGGMSNAPTSYDAANTLDGDAQGNAYESTANNQNAILVDGKTITLDGVTVSKTGDATGEDADFYGINAAILANNGSTLSISGSDVSTNGAHANGVFSYVQGTTINIADSTINTTGNNSGGLMTTGGAALNATNLTVATSGNSSAAIRTDRGGGTVTVTQGSYATSGVGSPAIYSTADITVSDATLSSTNSEAVVIEGGNSVTLNNSNVTGNNATLNGQSTQKTNVLIYQSMSGDASEGASNFSMTGGTLTSQTGSMFHVTNTTTTIDLNGVTLVDASDSDVFLSASSDAWGTSGKNGGNATVNLSNQTASGNIVVDQISSVTLNIKDSSSYTGAIVGTGTVNVNLEEGSTWTLTGDSNVTSLTGNTSGINLNGHSLYVNGTLWVAGS